MTEASTIYYNFIIINFFSKLFFSIDPAVL